MAQLRLIDNFAPEQIGRIESEIEQTRISLAQNASAMHPIRQRLGALADRLATLPSVEEKLLRLAKGDADVSVEVDMAHRHKALRDREKRTVDSVLRLLTRASKDVEAIVGRITQEVKTLADPQLFEGPNGSLLRTILERAYHCGQSVDRTLEESRTEIAGSQATIRQHHNELFSSQDQQELDFRRVIMAHKEAQSRVVERAELERVRNELLDFRREHKELQRQYSELQHRRSVLLERLGRLRDDRFSVRVRIAYRINETLRPMLRVQIDDQGDTSPLRRLLVRQIKDTGMKHNMVARKIAAKICPVLLAQTIRNGDITLLVDQAGLTPQQAKKTISVLDNPEFLCELELVEIGDLPTIELLDRGEYKPSHCLSTGQKCTSILPILLIESSAPLLIDQPEDNLDNHFIYSTIVQGIRAIKPKRQLIFITHNPNIPVLGDAERVFVLGNADDGGRLLRSGTVNQCRRQIVDLLEGGQEAFEARGRKYLEAEDQ